MALDLNALNRLYRGLTENFMWLNKYYVAMNDGNAQQR